MSADFHWLTSDEVDQARALWKDCVDNQLYGLINELFPMRSPEMRASAVDEALKGNCMVGEANA